MVLQIPHRQKQGLCNHLGAYGGVVERTADDQAWTVRVEAPAQVYQSVFDYPSMTEAQAWVEAKITALLRASRSPSSG
jgi:hypothetical protein